MEVIKQKRIIFWQNILSPHQFSLFNELVNTFDIIILVEEVMSTQRAEMGWSSPKLHANISILEIKDIYIEDYVSSGSTAIHFFSGINAYPLISRALYKALRLNLDVNLILEPQNWIGLKGLYNWLRSSAFAFMYGKRINRILAIGNKGPWWYQKCGFSERKIFEWGYTIDVQPDDEDLDNPYCGKINFVFVGRLIKVKGISMIIRAFAMIDKKSYASVTIVGDGPESAGLKKLSNKLNVTDKIIFVGKKPQKEANNFIENADLLILPSIGKEGWGAVVSESLLLGTPVLVSNRVGASILVDETNGFVIPHDNLEALINTLQQFIAQFNKSTILNRKTLQSQSLSRIGKVKFREYFTQIVLNDFSNKAIPPWQEKKRSF